MAFRCAFTNRRTLAIGAFATGLLLCAATGAADAVPTSPPPPTPTPTPTATLPPHIAVIGTENTCDGWILVYYSIEDLHGTFWEIYPDDGATVTPQIYFIGNGSIGGRWGDLPAIPRGEGIIRVDLRGIPTHEPLMRVRRNGITSTPKPIIECSPEMLIEQ